MNNRNPLKKRLCPKKYLYNWKYNFNKPAIPIKHNNINKYTSNLHKLPNNMIISEVITRDANKSSKLLYDSNLEQLKKEKSQKEIFKQRYSSIYDINITVPEETSPKNIKWGPQLTTIHEYDNNEPNFQNVTMPSNEEIEIPESSFNNSPTNNQLFEENYDTNEVLLPTENLNESLNDSFEMNNSNHTFYEEIPNFDATLDYNWGNMSPLSASASSNLSNSFSESSNFIFSNNDTSKESKWTPFCQDDKNILNDSSNNLFEKNFNDNVPNVLSTKIVKTTYFNFD